MIDSVYTPKSPRSRATVLVVALLTLFFSFSSFAVAQDKPEKPGQGTKVKVKKVETEKKDGDKKPDVVTGPSADKETVEVGGRDPKEIERIQKKIQKINKKQIAKLERILEKNPGDDDKPDILFQMAELKNEVLKTQSLFERAKWIKCLESEQAGTLAEGTCKEPITDYSPAMDIYKRVLQEFPSYSRLDEVIYRLGDGLMKAGKKKEAISFLTRLVQNYPKSPYIVDSHITIGDYFFDGKLLVAASDSYKKAMEVGPKHPLNNYARYKLAWVYYNQGEFRVAVDTFKKVIDAEKGRIGFAKQALNDIVVSWAEIEDGWEDARNYFPGKCKEHNVAKDCTQYNYKKMRQFAALYERDGKNEQRIAVLQWLLGEDPIAKKAPDYWEGIIEARKNINNREEWDSSVRKMIGYFDPQGKWWGANQSDKKAVNNARMMAEGYLYQLASEAHQQAQKDNDKALYEQAAKDYALFIEKFPDGENAYDVNFYYAEILYGQLEKYDKAAEQYKKVQTMKPDGEYAKDSLYAVISAYNQLVLRDHEKSVLVRLASNDTASRMEAVNAKKDEELKGAKKTERSDLFKWEVPFVEASDDWAKTYPKDKETPTVNFISAEVFRSHGQYDKAVPRYEQIIENAPKHLYASYAGNSLLECHNELGNWSEIERWARYLYENKIFDVTPKDKLISAIMYAINNTAIDLKKEKKYDEAAKKLLALAEEWPKSEDAPTAIFNAAAIYESGEMIKKAVANYERLIKEYPKHERAPEALFVMGAVFEARTDFERAAGYFERLGDNKDWLNHEKAQDAVFNSAYIRESLEQWDKSIKTYEKFIKLYGKKSDLSPKLAFHVGELYMRANKAKDAEKAFTNFIRKYPKSPELHVHAYLELAKIAAAKGGTKNEKVAAKHLAKTIDVWEKLEDEKKKRETKLYAAEARFLQGEKVLAESQKIQLAFPANVLQKTMLDRGTLVDKAQTIYFQVIELKDPFWTAAAAYRIGQMYKELAQQLYDLPVPEGLPPEVEDEYRASVDDFAFPLQEKSLTAFKTALKLALELNAYNEWSAKSAQEMSKLEKELYPITDQDGLTSEQVAEIYLKSKQLALKDVEQRAKDTKATKKPAAPAKPSVEPGEMSPTSSLQ